MWKELCRCFRYRNAQTQGELELRARKQNITSPQEQNIVPQVRQLKKQNQAKRQFRHTRKSPQTHKISPTTTNTMPLSQSPPTTSNPPFGPLLLKEAPLLLQHDYLPMEAGYALNSDGMWHIAASTCTFALTPVPKNPSLTLPSDMINCTGAMIDWWFSHIQSTSTYLLWHPRDHVFSDWEGPRDSGQYIGGSHLVKEYIGGTLQSLKITFCSPSVHFGANWKSDFQKAGYSTAICGRVGIWDQEKDTVVYTGHLIHLIKEEIDGCRMRSRFWLGDIDAITDPAQRANLTPDFMKQGLCKHATEEMAILAKMLPDLYRTYSGNEGGMKPKI